MTTLTARWSSRMFLSFWNASILNWLPNARVLKFWRQFSKIIAKRWFSGEKSLGTLKWCLKENCGSDFWLKRTVSKITVAAQTDSFWTFTTKPNLNFFKAWARKSRQEVTPEKRDGNTQQYQEFRRRLRNPMKSNVASATRKFAKSKRCILANTKVRNK